MAAAALAPCAPETPAALQLTGIPSVAIPGHGYLASLVGRRAGGRLGGLGLRRHRRLAGAARPRTTSTRAASRRRSASGCAGRTRSRPPGPSRWATCGTCLRTVTVPLPIERQILAVVNASGARRSRRAGSSCAATAPSCGSTSLKWSGWNGDTTTGRGKLNGRPATVKLSSAARVLAAQRLHLHPRDASPRARGRSSASLSTVRFHRGHEDLDRPRPGAERARRSIPG